MSVFEAFILGIIQGLTEFLPISSSGHLVIGQNLLGISIYGNTFEVIVHLGTLFSVFIVFWDDIYKLSTTLKNKKTQKYIACLLIGTIPAALVGILFNNQIGELFENLKVVALTLSITGIVLIITKFMEKGRKNITLINGLLIGLAQALAIIPGFSRSGLTISTGLFLGISSEEAAKFSFLLAIPAIVGAGLITAMGSIGSELGSISIIVGTTGFLTSLIVGWISLKFLISLIKKGRFYWFGVYCIIIGSACWMI
jgi:undecaprenyl-diphosphatase